MCTDLIASMTIDVVSVAAAAPVSTSSPAGTPALLQLIWLASPALPIGGFSYSEGLEAAIDHGLVHDEHSAAEWLMDQLHLTQSRGDMAVLGEMITAWQALDHERLETLSQWVHATRESAELRLQSEQMGRSMLEWLRNQEAIDSATIALCNRWVPTYPLMFALALSRTGASLEQCLQTYAFGWAENMVQAAIKSVPLGQNSGQRMLTKLAQHIAPAVSHAMQVNDDTRQAFSPMLAILSAQHETQYSRLFRS
ncbi:urease accessory protein UreF [Limnohabitans curvus]|uniref:Urease accessory protein UreF n=2 Tax=Limnohabitans curvus TaxID=323423 RepID=A0A315ENK0_9BURK|nr:urease accessory protein UreF [Limnohabitans curvus]